MRPDVLFTQSVFAESLVARGADVAAAWLLTYLVHSMVILALAWIVTSRPRVTDTVREVIWKFALVGGLLTASIQTAVAREPLGGQFRLAPRTAVPAEELRISMRSAHTAEQRRFVVARSRGMRWSAALVVVWLTGSGAGLLWLTFRHARTLRVLSDRTSLDGTSVRSRLDALQRRAGVSATISLTCSGSIASPLALAGDEVCLPRRALLELTPNEQEGMLAHEIAHLVRRDPQWLIAARAIETVLFMQPLNRLARRRLQEAAEFLCDDWAVSRMSQPVTLAKCLAAVAEWVGRAPRMQVPRLHPMSAMVESAGSPLVRRVGRILNGRVAPRAGTSRWTFAASALVLVALAATAPRVSVAHAAATDRIVGLVRAMSTGPGAPGRDSIMVVRATRARFAVDSLVRRRRGGAAGAVTERADIIVIERRP